jgi:hypothetical protein
MKILTTKTKIVIQVVGILTAEAIGELTDIDEFEDKIDPDIERPVGQPGLRMKDSQGKEFSLEN